MENALDVRGYGQPNDDALVDGLQSVHDVYGREVFVSNEVGQYRYRSWEDYNEAVAEHARLIWEIHALARERMTRVQVDRRAK